MVMRWPQLSSLPSIKLVAAFDASAGDSVDTIKGFAMPVSKCFMDAVFNNLS